MLHFVQDKTMLYVIYFYANRLDNMINQRELHIQHQGQLYTVTIDVVYDGDFDGGHIGCAVATYEISCIEEGS